MPSILDTFAKDPRFSDIGNDGLRLLAAMAQMHHESERSVVVLSGAFVDELISETIRICLVDNTKVADDLFKPGKPIGDFGAKNKLALLMGIIEKDVFDELNTFASIRNDFAHKIEFDTFDDDRISSKVMSMQLLRSAAKRGGSKTIKSPRFGELCTINQDDNDDILKDAKTLFSRTVQLFIALLSSARSKAVQARLEAQIAETAAGRRS